MYSSGQGIIGAGRVVGDTQGPLRASDEGRLRGTDWQLFEWQIPLRWLYWSPDKPIPFDCLNATFYDISKENWIDKRRAVARALEALPPEPNRLPPPERVTCKTTRIIRDTLLPWTVKVRHNFECQICGETIELPDGRRYAEAHHIQPLGGEHGGVDTIENMLCLCPNHHAELDLGARQIRLESLRAEPGHNVGQEFVEYHNTHIADRR